MTNRRQPFIIILLQILSQHSGPIACRVNYVSQSMKNGCRVNNFLYMMHGSGVEKYLGVTNGCRVNNYFILDPR